MFRLSSCPARYQGRFATQSQDTRQDQGHTPQSHSRGTLRSAKHGNHGKSRYDQLNVAFAHSALKFLPLIRLAFVPLLVDQEPADKSLLLAYERNR
jgi:hypothetical protein